MLDTLTNKSLWVAGVLGLVGLALAWQYTDRLIITEDEAKNQDTEPLQDIPF